MILDVFSRYVPGWMVASRERAALAQRLIADSVAKQGIEPDSLTNHADRGSSMTSRPVALLLADLGIIKSHSRPHVSNDSPHSEAGRTPRPASRRSSTRVAFPIGSAPSRMPGPSARGSSPGTTPSTATAGSPFTAGRRPLRRAGELLVR
jgi:transposase InsO family protein